MCNHDWIRTNGATTEDGADTYRCSKCPATGKSFGLTGLSAIVEDSKSSRNTRQGYYSQTYEYRKIRKQQEDAYRSFLSGSKGRKWSMAQYKKRAAPRDGDNAKETE